MCGAGTSVSSNGVREKREAFGGEIIRRMSMRETREMRRAAESEWIWDVGGWDGGKIRRKTEIRRYRADTTWPNVHRAVLNGESHTTVALSKSIRPTSRKNTANRTCACATRRRAIARDRQARGGVRAATTIAVPGAVAVTATKVALVAPAATPAEDLRQTRERASTGASAAGVALSIVAIRRVAVD